MDEKIIIIRDPKTFCFNFDWPKDVDENLNHEIEFIKKTRLNGYCWNTSMEAILMNKENRKTNEPHKFVLNLSQRLDLRSLNKHVALQKLSIYYTWKNIRKLYKNNTIIMSLNYQIVLNLCQIFKSDISLKCMKH